MPLPLSVVHVEQCHSQRDHFFPPGPIPTPCSPRFLLTNNHPTSPTRASPAGTPTPAPIPIVFGLLLLATTGSEIVVGTGVDVLEAVEDVSIANVLELLSSLLTGEVVATLDKVKGVVVLCTTEFDVLVNVISGARPTVVKTSKVPPMGQIHTRKNPPCT
ncbi:hypothetical protein HYALB_00013374 [Hymenoscyphus albidus]|uniref:Uncharacterized protein n=1 Tax=Hymenoscyphus albidus TaxID=595503 RepID=A0A9N9LWI0_9HELO|nr:hypothetical protein HYALB_00013374 [Hymenoscyphus albidus]